MKGKAPKAVVFDVFGTLVDWRGSIAREAEAVGIKDGAAFADAWRKMYHPSLDSVRRGETEWRNLDQLHTASLDALLPEWGQGHLGADVRARLIGAWHRLTPWPDTVAGLKALKAHAIIGPLSNGHVALQVDLAKHNGLPWDVVFGADLYRHYKPDPETYLGAAHFLGLEPGELMLAAAHNNDLAAARRHGLQTGFISRPMEWGEATGDRAVANADWEIVAETVEDFAARFGAWKAEG